jgi:CubicO group peptidase (beta-lactamase class C family)
MSKKTFAIGLFVVIGFVIFAVVLKPRLIKSDQAITPSSWPTHGWPTSSPEAQGFSSAKLAEALLEIKNHMLTIDSLLIIRNGQMLLDAYFYPFDHSIPHQLASVTKSFTTTLIGMAIDQGKLQIDQPLISFFADRSMANLDDLKMSITVQDLVSNMNGFESDCFHGDVATLSKMRANEDWIQAALDRKVVVEPGTKFCYDSPGMHLLSAILQESTGVTELDFAREYLFKPLGIDVAFWESDPQGYTHGWSDLYLKPLDAAKLGYLWLNKGKWENQQIISESWVENSIRKISNGGIDYYGYGWWVSDDNYYALGRLGQYIKIYPDINLIVVATAHGLEYDEIAPWLDAAFIDPLHPLPADPPGEARLQEVVTAAAMAPHPWQVGPLPDAAHEISGKTFRFATNPLKLASLQLQFSGEQEAKLYLNLEGQDLVWPIGLDGDYRLEPAGRAVRGYWSDRHTFSFEIFEDGFSTYQLKVVENGVLLETLSLSIQGQETNP